MGRAKQIYDWLGKNSEPWTAILALLISFWSAVLGIRGIGLANEGVAIAARTARIERLPIMNVVIDEDTNSIELQNVGFGPSDVFRIHLAYKDKLITLKSDASSRDQAILLSAFFRDAARTVEASPKLSAKVAPSLMLYRTEQREKLIAFNEMSPEDKQSLKMLWRDISLRICYRDVVGESRSINTFGSFVFGPEQTCDEPPPPFALP